LARLIQTRQRTSPGEKLIVLGDFDASEFSDGHGDLMAAVTGREAPSRAGPDSIGGPIPSPLTNLTTLVPQAERYTVTRNGNAVALSHILVNQAMLASFPGLHLEMARVNADFGADNLGDSMVPMRAAERDPQVLYLQRP
jgi:hypothetical protein